MMVDVLFLPVGSEVINRTRRCAACPWTLIADIRPNPALLHTFAQSLVAQRPIQHPDRRIVSVEDIALHDLDLNTLNQWPKRLHGTTAPVHQCAVRYIDTHPREDLVEAIERQMIVELRDQNIGHKARTSHATRYRAAGRRNLHHLLATTARLLWPGDLDNLHRRCDHIED